MESYSTDPDCKTFCGKNVPYITYPGIPFCVKDANVEDWVIVDLSTGSRVKDTTMKIAC